MGKLLALSCKLFGHVGTKVTEGQFFEVAYCGACDRYYLRDTSDDIWPYRAVISDKLAGELAGEFVRETTAEGGR